MVKKIVIGVFTGAGQGMVAQAAFTGGNKYVVGGIIGGVIGAIAATKGTQDDQYDDDLEEDDTAD